MRVIRRAARFAHVFVSLNYEQAAAIKYVVRPAPDPNGCAPAVRHTDTSHGPQGAFMTKFVLLGVATMSVVAVTGTPGTAGTTPAVIDAVQQFATAVWVAPGPAFYMPVQGTPWGESGSLLLVASSFFAAAVLLRRRAR